MLHTGTDHMYKTDEGGIPVEGGSGVRGSIIILLYSSSLRRNFQEVLRGVRLEPF
jgi:hypothetical protein